LLNSPIPYVFDLLAYPIVSVFISMKQKTILSFICEIFVFGGDDRSLYWNYVKSPNGNKKDESLGSRLSRYFLSSFREAPMRRMRPRSLGSNEKTGLRPPGPGRPAVSPLSTNTSFKIT